jgi:hypothetical protein
MTSNNKNNNPKESLEESIIEMQLIRKGKLPKITWEEFRKTLERDN